MMLTFGRFREAVDFVELLLAQHEPQTSKTRNLSLRLSQICYFCLGNYEFTFARGSSSNLFFFQHWEVIDKLCPWITFCGIDVLCWEL